MALTHKYIAIGNPSPEGNGNTAATPYLGNLWELKFEQKNLNQSKCHQRRFVEKVRFNQRFPSSQRCPLVSTDDEFDAIMHEIGVSTHIHLAAGTYFTYGQRYPVGYNRGWDVKSGWTISGAGEGATTLKLHSWPGDTIVVPPGSKWSVIGNPLAPESALVSDVVIEHLAVDGNWMGLADDGLRPTGWPHAAQTALHCVACIIDGPITYRKLTVTGFYARAESGSEGFALSCHAYQVMDPVDMEPSLLAVFDHCTVHHGHGNYSVGIASFNRGPSIIHDCHIYSLANSVSGAIQAIGKNILITHNIVDSFKPFYVDTGNIINLLMDENHFISSERFAISSNHVAQVVFINVRQDDNQGDMDGVWMDVPIRPVAETRPHYRVRLYFKKNGSTKSPPDIPLDPDGVVCGIRVACPYGVGASKETLEAIGGPISEGLDAYFASAGIVPFLDNSTYAEAALLLPVRIGASVNLNNNGGVGTVTNSETNTAICNFTASAATNLLTTTQGAAPPTVGQIVTVSGSVPVPLGVVLPQALPPMEWLVVERDQANKTFKLAWMHQIVDLTTNTAGILKRPGKADLAYTASATTNLFTLIEVPTSPLVNRETVYVSGARPSPLEEGRPYEVRKISGLTFHLAWSPDTGERINHSASAPSTGASSPKDGSEVYVQSGWSWTHWRIRNNYFEVPFFPKESQPTYQAVMLFSGNGSVDGDYHITGNVSRFTGTFDGLKMFNILMAGIDRVGLRDNALDYRELTGSC